MNTEKNTEMGEAADALTGSIIGCAIEVHRLLGPGLLESAYEQCLLHEMSLKRIPFNRQVPLPIAYKGIRLDCGYRIDLLVSGVVVELKSVDRLLPIHEAQLMTYMKLYEAKTGLLINFNERRLSDGIKRLKRP